MIIDFLLDNGWVKDVALDFVFDYTRELDLISNCDSSKIDNYFNGRGNEFNQMLNTLILYAYEKEKLSPKGRI